MKDSQKAPQIDIILFCIEITLLLLSDIKDFHFRCFKS